MNKLLIISGPTATGKTSLAVKIAKKYGGELISADSRQIYQGLDIGVGKDHPQGTPIHLIDVIAPDKTFSVAEFSRLALPKIRDLQSKSILPILVGCSGQYIDSVINPRPTYTVKPHLLLRHILEHLPLRFLKFGLWVLDFGIYSKLNQSDINNPRRLVRKIEIKLSGVPPLSPVPFRGSKRGLVGDFDILHLSLTAPNSFLFPRIDARVEERLRIGHLKELKNLLKKYSWESPGLKVSAYQVFKRYFGNKTSIEDSIQKWKYLEHRDARHQKTWFNKKEGITFIDITRKDYLPKVQKLIAKWYNKL